MSWQLESELFECYDCEKEQYGEQFTDSDSDEMICNSCVEEGGE
jgi:hypothetical protein